MAWPSTLVAYRRTEVFTEETVPESLLSEHDLNAGVWGLLRVLEGELGFVDLEEGREVVLNRAAPCFIEPQQRHRVELRGPVKFYIEYYRGADTEVEEE